MASLNKLMLIGNLGTPPEMSYTPSGSPVTKFRLAVSRVWTDEGGQRKEETEWLSVIAWNKLAETANQFLNKGHKVYVEGRLRTRTWENKEGGKSFAVECIAEKILFLEKMEPRKAEQTVEETVPPEDLPFA